LRQILEDNSEPALSNDKFATLLTLIATMPRIQAQTSFNSDRGLFGANLELIDGRSPDEKIGVGLSAISFFRSSKKDAAAIPNAARSAGLPTQGIVQPIFYTQFFHSLNDRFFLVATLWSQ